VRDAVRDDMRLAGIDRSAKQLLRTDNGCGA
jgi:hypothetical protein